MYAIISKLRKYKIISKYVPLSTFLFHLFFKIIKFVHCTLPLIFEKLALVAVFTAGEVSTNLPSVIYTF